MVSRILRETKKIVELIFFLGRFNTLRKKLRYPWILQTTAMMFLWSFNSIWAFFRVMTHLWEKCIFKAIKSVVWFHSRVKLAHVKNGSKELWKDFHANPVINPAEFLIRPCHFYKFPHRSNSVGQKVSRGGKGVEITSRKRNIKRK